MILKDGVYIGINYPKTEIAWIYSLFLFGAGSHKIIIVENGVYEVWEIDKRERFEWTCNKFFGELPKKWKVKEVQVSIQEARIKCTEYEGAKFFEGIFNCYYYVNKICGGLGINYKQLLR